MNNIKKIKELLIALGITPDIKGFNYLAVAIEDALSSFNSAGEININFMGLYSGIAVLHNDTSSRVERAMRWAVERAFKKPSAMLKSIFTFMPDEGAAKVSISCFICTVSHYLYYEE